MRYTFVKQHDATDCAAACLAMICIHYKKETSISKLRDLMGTDIRGTNLLGLSKCAEQLGFITRAVRVDRSGFMSDFSLPAIANVVTKEGMTHYVVVFKITKDKVVIGDPGSDLLKITINEFYETFTGVLLLLIPSSSFDRNSDKGTTVFQRYISLLIPQKKLFIYGLIASALLTVLGIVSSLINSIIYDEVLPYKQSDVLVMIMLAFVGISISQIILDFIRQWMMIYLSIKIDIPLMLGYFEHIFNLPMRFFSSRRTGDITTRFSDAFIIKDVFTNIALTLILDVSMAAITGAILFKMNPSLFSVIFIVTIVNVILVFIFKQPYKRINEEQMQQSSILNSEIIEGLRAIETIKSNSYEAKEIENIEREYIKSIHIGVREGMLSNGQNAIASLISTSGNLALLYFGMKQVMNAESTLGLMMAFMTLAGYFMDPIQRLVGLQLSIQEAGISMKRISEILDYEEEQESKDKNGLYIETVTFDKEIEFKDVGFRYGNREPALNNVSFSIKKGEKVAIVGASGSGKSTIAKLLLKYYEPESGTINIDGISITEYNNKTLRNAISYVPQNIELFSKSVFDNIRLTKPGASIDEVKLAARTADADGFIRKLPHQYYTFLEEAGNGLSGGEKQRLVLSRAFLKKCEFIILDESTSNLDFATENIIFDSVYNKLKEKTVLIIAHRLATVKHCDKIIVLHNGEIIECGSHEQLMKVGGEYCRLWEMQQGDLHETQKLYGRVKSDSNEEEFDEEDITY